MNSSETVPPLPPTRRLVEDNVFLLSVRGRVCLYRSQRLLRERVLGDIDRFYQDGLEPEPVPPAA